MFYLIGFFLLFVLLLLVIIYFVFKKSKPEVCEINPEPKQASTYTLESLIKVLKTEKKDASVIDDALEKMVGSFPFPDNEKEAGQHFKFVYFYAKNPLATAKMIVQMQKKVSLANPKHAKQIEEFQMRGVDARKA